MRNPTEMRTWRRADRSRHAVAGEIAASGEGSAFWSSLQRSKRNAKYFYFWRFFFPKEQDTWESAAKIFQNINVYFTLLDRIGQQQVRSFCTPCGILKDMSKSKRKYIYICILKKLERTTQFQNIYFRPNL